MKKIVAFVLSLSLLSPQHGLAILTPVMMSEFTLKDIHTNKIVKLSDSKEKVILVDFWASWCIPCRVSFPQYKALYEKYKSQSFQILAINVDSEVTKALDFLNDYPVPFIVLQGGKNLAAQLNIETMPTSFLLDSNKKIIKMHSGFKSDDIADLESEINKIISSGNNYAENPALRLIRPTYQSSEAHHYVKR